MDYSKCKKYFKEANLKIIGIGILLVILGIWLIISAINNYDTPIIGGILLFFGIVLFIANYVKRSISDSQYDELINNEIMKAKEFAISELDIDSSEIKDVNPITFHYFNFDEFENIKTGKDGKVRTDRYKLVIIYPMQDELNVYDYDFSTTHELKIKEGTSYFYEDIVSVSITTDTHSVVEMKKSKFPLKLKFLKNPSNKTVTYMMVKFWTKAGKCFIAYLDSPNDSLRALRALLREKKRGK